MDDRDNLIGGLRDLADLLSKRAVVPTPIVAVTGSMIWGHSFGDVLNLVEVLAPCRITDSTIGDDKKVVEAERQGVRIRVLVDAAACGETRIINGEPRFMVDTEVLRVAAHPKPVPVPA